MRLNLIYYLTATALGGLHALEPGHGKTVVAAYLIGTKGRRRDAVLLGLVVTLTHTFSVILLAIAAKIASNKITLTEESLHGYLGLVAGLLILTVGLWMLWSRLKGREPFHFHSHDHGHGHSHNHVEVIQRHSHDHPHDLDHNPGNNPHSHNHTHAQSQEHHEHTHNPGHHHDHDHHPHGHNPGHSHSHDHDDDHNQHHHEPHEVQALAPGGQKGVGFWQLFLLGVSGGLVPCPAAIAILLAAVAAGRLGEGLTYILLFSLGLAAALITVGLIVVSAGKLASRFLDAKKFARKVSIASAAIITLIGVVTVANSLRHVL